MTRATVTVLAVVLVVAGLTGGVSWIADQTRGTGPTTPRERTRDLDVAISYVGRTPAGPRLFTEHRAVPDTKESAPTAALRTLMTDPPRDHDYRNYWLALGTSASVKRIKGNLTVDLDREPHRPAGLDSRTAPLMFQAMVSTVDDAASSTAPVRFTVGGREVPEILGVSTAEPIARSDADTVGAVVSIASPYDGQVLDRGPLTVTGVTVSRVGVAWELQRRTGGLLQQGVAAPEECCTRSSYVFTTRALPVGAYTVVVRAPDGSEDSKDVTVR